GHLPDIRKTAAENHVWSTTDDVSVADWPFRPDVITSVYYRRIISKEVIEKVGGKIFNVHPSLLPRHRGCSSLTWAIIEGDPVTGITFHYIDQGVDTGRILLQAVLQIEPTETQATLYKRAMKVGLEFWPAAFELVKAGVEGVPQQGMATFHKRETPYGG